MNPGSPGAIKSGCTCPSEGNRDGFGANHLVSSNADPSNTHFVISESCELHGRTTWREALLISA